ncbi:hypothetical protein ACM9NO_29210, partial [Pseudomonas paraeruginosa]
AELFAALLAMEQGELVKLLAVCVASTVDVVTPRATPHQPGEELAQAVGLDMAAWWQPTAEGYFKHVPKAAVPVSYTHLRAHETNPCIAYG